MCEYISRAPHFTLRNFVCVCVCAETSRVDGGGDHRAAHSEGQAVSPEVGKGRAEEGLGDDGSQEPAILGVGEPPVQATAGDSASRARYTQTHTSTQA